MTSTRSTHVSRSHARARRGACALAPRTASPHTMTHANRWNVLDADVDSHVAVASSRSIVDASDDENDRRRALRRLAVAVARAGSFGCVVRGGLSLGKIALRASRGGRRRRGNDARAVMLEVLSYGLFTAAFAGTYVSVDEGLKKERERGEGRLRKTWRCALAGACAGTSLLVVGGEHYALAGYVWVRSLVLLTRVAQKSENETARRLSRCTRWEHGDVALMTGSAAVILSCFILKPELVDPAYRHFLEVHAGKTIEEYAALKELCLADGDAARRALCSKLATSATWSTGESAREVANKTMAKRVADGSGTIDAMGLYRLLFFQGASNPEHFFTHVAKSFTTTLRVYMPVYLVPALVVHRGKLFSRRRGPDLLMRIAKGSARSALFLSSYVGAAWSGVDVANRALGGTCDVRSLSVGVSMAGLATFIEKKSRRMELAMYCVSRALECAAMVAVQRGLVPKFVQRQRCDIVLFSLASATIMHCYSTERDVFKSKYLNVLDYIFGCTGHDSQTISHVASYEILFASERKSGPPGETVVDPPTPREMVDLGARTTYVTEKDFREASAKMSESLVGASVEEILNLYGLYKQAVAGDARDHPRPSVFDPKGRAKYAAWEHFEGTTSEAAMTGYVTLVNSLTRKDGTTKS